jgi:type I restriction enzyme, S subunit
MDGDFNCALWRGRPALLNQRVCKVTPDESTYLKRFLAYVLPGYLAAINAYTHSVTVKHLSSRTIADIPLPHPPLAEQRRIVEEIEKQFTRLEAGVAALKRVQAGLKRYRASVLKAACEGKLVPTEVELQRQLGTRNLKLAKLCFTASSSNAAQNGPAKANTKNPPLPTPPTSPNSPKAGAGQAWIKLLT